MNRRRIVVLATVTLGLAAVMTTTTWALARTAGPSLGPGTMMGGYGLAGDGRRIDSLDAARARAQLYADRLGLRVGEVMRFSNGFYAEIVTTDDQGATEVLINQDNGGVGVEPGPAMMWNTRYGMHPAAGPATISADQAQGIAQQWLDRAKPGLRAGQPEVFPGYVTIDTTRDSSTVGMMSVNTSTGAVWYHTWHGDFVAASEG
jgi:hypothetical protein